VARAYLRNSRRISLGNKVVLITGGSRGLGLVLAREFAARGARVAICARNSHELERVRKEFADAGTEVFAETCDVGVRQEIGTVINHVRERWGEIDILVNNAGTIMVGPVENQDLEAFEEAMQTNFWGAYYATSAVLGAMKKRRAGRIVNITSIGGKVAFPHLLPYAASKFALVGFSQGLRAELLKDKVYVTTVCPGLMRTGSPRNADFAGQHEKEYAWFTISDSLPVASIDSKAAARQILNACVHGEAEVHLGIAAKVGAIVQGVTPGWSSEILGVVNEFMLPRAAPAKRRVERQKGSQSESELTAGVLTTLTREAEKANNQV
jgi:short-subunit dehydrogenase